MGFNSGKYMSDDGAPIIITPVQVAATTKFMAEQGALDCWETLFGIAGSKDREHANRKKRENERKRKR